MDKVSIRRIGRSLDDTLNQILSDLRVDLSDQRKIIIKPNLCNYLHPSTASTTDVHFIDLLVKLIRNVNENCPIYIVESDSQGKLADIAFKLLGYTSLEKIYNKVTLVNLTKCKKIKKNFEGFHFEGFEYPELFNEKHFFISVPKLKTFDGVTDLMTCALKNQFGCNPYPKKMIYHNNLSKVIYDLNKLFMPDLILVDSMVAMEGFGPSSGIPKKMNILIGGNMPASVDVVCAKIMGISYKKVKHLKFALDNAELGSDIIEIIGDDLNDVKQQFILPKKKIWEKLLKI